uniref:CCHC-type domain-containing protein n=1 Tax=Ananas comosus var. bracteatus TaxID=296719 RepID=A0A6V7PLX7_ANACO|nr:unnamed protein product [Ananas comosus var. bracteatus]
MISLWLHNVSCNLEILDLISVDFLVVNGFSSVSYMYIGDSVRLYRRNSIHVAGLCNTRRKKIRNNYGRCFKCLASDHRIADCRDPVRCIRCRKSGHRAYNCKEEDPKDCAMMNRAFGNASVSQKSTYLTWRNFEKEGDTLKCGFRGRPLLRSGLRHLPPEWVYAKVLIRREVTTLDGFWIRCYPWGQYRSVRPHRVSHRAWIRLINLPFECWTIARVAALVGGFERFVKADDITKGMTNLRTFRCQITLDSLRDIPQNMAIVLEEEVFSVRIHLESWERVTDAAGEDPPPPTE